LGLRAARFPIKWTHLIGTESLKTGKTTVLTGEQARELLDSIITSTLVGLRDRAVISVMTFAFARIGTVVAMRAPDQIRNCPRAQHYAVGGSSRRASRYAVESSDY
jgi:hypothetical protein